MDAHRVPLGDLEALFLAVILPPTPPPPIVAIVPVSVSVVPANDQEMRHGNRRKGGEPRIALAPAGPLIVERPKGDDVASPSLRDKDDVFTRRRRQEDLAAIVFGIQRALNPAFYPDSVEQACLPAD